MVATDGHRLSLISRTVEGGTPGPSVIIPRKGIMEITKVIESGDEPVTLSVHGGVAHATRGNVELSMRLVEGEFPDYRQVVPQKSERRLVVGVESLFAALRRVSIVSSERTRGIKMQIETGKLDISSINPDVGEATEEIAADYEGEPLAIGFNAKYLIDVLQVLEPSAQVEISFTDDVSPAVLRCEGESDFLYVVMPMRL